LSEREGRSERKPGSGGGRGLRSPFRPILSFIPVLAETITKTYFFDLSSYPQWLVVLVGTLVAALILWILIKVLRVALWLLFFAILIGGVAWAGWLLLH
jgi:hypothetical protein